jgi:hypothetical protein
MTERSDASYGVVNKGADRLLSFLPKPPSKAR